MKKISFLLLIMGLFIPSIVSAKSYDFNSYYCDAKQDQKDGTFKEVCHIIVTSDFDVNHIKVKLQLKNVILESVKTSGSWINTNGLSNSMEFTTNSSYKGTFNVADLIFVGNMDDEECEASIIPELVEKTNNKVCAIIDDQYYGKNGNIVNEETYYEECCNYVCTVVDNKYYFNSKGQSVDYNSFLNDCSTISESPATGFNYGYIIFPIGLISLFAFIKLIKKNTKIYKI